MGFSSGSLPEDGLVVKQLLSSVGLCEEVPESQQDAFTGMAGRDLSKKFFFKAKALNHLWSILINVYFYSFALGCL